MQVFIFDKNFFLLNELANPYLLVHQYDKRWSEFENSIKKFKLQINIYRDNADPDFAVIQFVHTIDNNFVPFATFSISRGTQHGSGIYDLDYVFQDSLLLEIIEV